MKKMCSSCKRVLDLNDFYNKKASPDGKDSLCKACKKDMAKIGYEKNKEKRKAQAREYYRAHKEESCERAKKWRKDNLERARENDRRRYKEKKAREV